MLCSRFLLPFPSCSLLLAFHAKLLEESRLGGATAVADILKKKAKYPEIDVDFRDIDDRTSLFWAVVQKHKDIVELLLRAGADAALKAKSGK